MPSCESFHDGLQTEKADAMRGRSRRKRSVFFRPQLLVLALLCCLFTWILGLKGLSALKFYALLLIQLIVLLVYLLSADNGNRINDEVVEPDLCDQVYTTVFRESKQLAVSPAPEILSEKVAFRDKHIVVCENVEYSPIEGKHRVRELAVVANDCAAVKVQEEEVKHYRRTRSELRAREKKSRRRLLRRWETENQRQLEVADCYSAARKSMDDLNSDWMYHLNNEEFLNSDWMYHLNSEEFRHVIESYIDIRKKISMNEHNAFLSKERTGQMTINCR